MENLNKNKTYFLYVVFKKNWKTTLIKIRLIFYRLIVIFNYFIILTASFFLKKKKKTVINDSKTGKFALEKPRLRMAQQNREVLYLDWALKKPTGFRSKYPRLLSPLCFRVYARPVSLCRREDTTFSLCNLVFQQVILHFFTFFRSTKGKLDNPKKNSFDPTIVLG